MKLHDDVKQRNIITKGSPVITPDSFSTQQSILFQKFLKDSTDPKSLRGNHQKIRQNNQEKFIIWDKLKDCVHSTDDSPNVSIKNQIYDESFEKKVISSPTFHVGSVTVRAEEIGLVIGILLLWAGAITLFINRWGKLRMLEPYQPQYSAPVESPVASRLQLAPFINIQSTSSLSLTDRASSPDWGAEGSYFTARRSIGGIAGSSTSLYTLNPSRKVRSAVDLVSLVMQEKLATTHRQHPFQTDINV